ncbi:MAG TPA: sodium:calcium antiporter [Micavibrio sp.]
MPEKGPFKFREAKPRPLVGAAKHEHGPGCNHDHDDHDCGHDHGHQTPPPPGLRGVFHRAAKLYKEYSHKPAALLVFGALLGTTAMISAPSLWVSGAIMAGALLLLKNVSDVTLAHTQAFGDKTGFSRLSLGLGLAAMTAVPECAVAISSIWNKTAEIGIGTLVGSNIAHVFLVLGATAAIAAIPKGRGLGWKFNTLAMAGATGVFASQMMTNGLTPTMGWVMAGLTGAYIAGSRYVAIQDAKSAGKDAAEMIHHHGEGSSCGHDHGPSDPSIKSASRLKNFMHMAGGIGGLAVASKLITDSAPVLASGLGLSNAAISAIAISFGTVLPELAMNITAARKGEMELGVGNVLGCNIFNALIVGGALSFAGMDVPASLSPDSPLGLFNLAALGASAGLMTTTLLAQKGAMKRWQGYAALGLYAAYLAGSGLLGRTAAPEDVEKIPQPAAISAPASPRISAQIPPQLYAPRQA